MDSFDETTLDLTKQLIRANSVSPDDAGCQSLIAQFLADLGFTIEQMPFSDVMNLWATRDSENTGGPVFVFAGHTDVVPPGPLDEWHTDPFEPVIKDDTLYGRGAADMKGSIAAMLTGTQRFLTSTKKHKGTIAFLITSDEEADAINGTVKVAEELERRGTKVTWCVVGEPTSTGQLGDTIKVGRRGSLNAVLTIKGQQGHIAYPDSANNPIHAALQSLADLAVAKWDVGNKYFPPTSFQISNIQGGTGANNVIPGKMRVEFNFRYSTESTRESLQSRTEEILGQYEFEYEIDWSLSGKPFMTEGGELIPAVQSSIRESIGIDTELSTSGGTSDGRFIAPLGAQVVELGPCNRTIHKVNECVSIKELHQLSQIYSAILQKMLGDI
ncbi:MAG: succinyl-diaminopimelate desuccinylase [Gammaproteobacteria bacterium]|jgi:succinyl-diaminopimelate desuccinylase|nr:succinyl-diaminopimelate desuccinylase [Gammaproteobacteria bacterium]|tara:strand:- start:48 stop:1202 length:1155 start_codon:yes stop_codon:yes gene_type:complete